MKKIIWLVFLISLFLVFGCSEDNPTNPSETGKYPTELNMQWEYSSTMIIEYYNSIGYIADKETLDLGNTIVRIININDSLDAYYELVKFESYDLLTSDQKKSDWYSNSDSGLTLIAYSNAGATQPVIPKIQGKRYITFNELISIIESPEHGIFSFSTSSPTDSIYYYEIPRRALAYPLTVNKRWVELVYLWYRERYVEKIVQGFFQGEATKCYVVKVNWPGFDIAFNDYISLDKGLMKREILADSIIITDPSNPDSGGFGRISNYSNLVRLVK
jgi:hypothetical protein